MANLFLTLLSESCVQPVTIPKNTWGRWEADLSAPDMCATKSGFPIIPCIPQDVTNCVLVPVGTLGPFRIF